MISSVQSGKVMMFHIGRSGSRVLGDMLNIQPDINWHGEVYRPLLKRLYAGEFQADGEDPDPVGYLEQHMLHNMPPISGFEVKFFHIRKLCMELSGFLEQLRIIGFDNFIILERRNYLRKVISSLVARKRGRYHIKSGEKMEDVQLVVDTNRITIDRESKSLVGFLEDYERSFRDLRMLLSGEKVLELSFEKDIACDPGIACEKVCTFLGLPQREVTARFVRTTVRPLGEIVSNYQELDRALAGTRFEWMLSE